MPRVAARLSSPSPVPNPHRNPGSAGTAASQGQIPREPRAPSDFVRLHPSPGSRSPSRHGRRAPPSPARPAGAAAAQPGPCGRPRCVRGGGAAPPARGSRSQRQRGGPRGCCATARGSRSPPPPPGGRPATAAAPGGRCAGQRGGAAGRSLGPCRGAVWPLSFSLRRSALGLAYFWCFQVKCMVCENISLSLCSRSVVDAGRGRALGCPAGLLLVLLPGCSPGQPWGSCAVVETFSWYEQQRTSPETLSLVGKLTIMAYMAAIISFKI